MTDIKEWFPLFEVSAETEGDLQKYFVQNAEHDKIIKSQLGMLLANMNIAH